MFFSCSAILNNDEDVDSKMQSLAADGVVPPLIVPPIISSSVPSIMTDIDVKTDSLFNVPVPDSDYCNNRYFLNISRCNHTKYLIMYNFTVTFPIQIIESLKNFYQTKRLNKILF